MRKSLLFACCLFLIVGSSAAQQLPQACFPGSMAPGCPPPNDPAWNPLGVKPPQISQRRWAPPWGAIANNPVTASLGLAGEKAYYSTRRAAEKAAIKMCKVNGGGDGCKVILAYSRTCGALAIGINGQGQGELFPGTAATELRAIDDIKSACNKTLSDCRVLHVHCVG